MHHIVFSELAVFGMLAWSLQWTHKVWVSALGLAVIHGWLRLYTGDFSACLIRSVIAFPIAYGYFYLLNRVDGENTWWFLAVLGGVILLGLWFC